MTTTETPTTSTRVQGVRILRENHPDAMAMWDAELRRQFHCPDWCQLDPHHHDVELAVDRAYVNHDGPTFGRYICAGGSSRAETGVLEEMDIRLETDLGLVTMTVDSLRQLSADALAAAEWLQAQS